MLREREGAQAPGQSGGADGTLGYGGEGSPLKRVAYPVLAGSARWPPIRRVLLVVVCLIGALTAGGWSVAGTQRGAAMIEALLGRTPPARIAAYVQAITRGDRTAAVGAWIIATDDSVYSRLLRERRKAVTASLLARQLATRITILRTQWWHTSCCMPGPFGAASDAGAARVQARLYDQRGRSLLVVFDLTTIGSYHGPVATANIGYWSRTWAVCDVYLAPRAPRQDMPPCPVMLLFET